jgi:hypothetical protein
MSFPYDKSSKWLIEQHGDQLLRLAGVTGIVSWKTCQTKTKFDTPPEDLRRQCRDIIERKAAPDDKSGLLATTQVLASLRYDSQQLMSLIGGDQAMLESPVLQRFMAEQMAKRLAAVRHNDILHFLRKRFGTIPEATQRRVENLLDQDQLDQLLDLAVECPTLAPFAERLPE